MDERHVRAAFDKAKGSLKDAAGRMTGDTRLQAQGKAAKAKGGRRQVFGDIRDFFRCRR